MAHRVALKKTQMPELEARLGYSFKDKDLLAEALTHASARASHNGRDNERLEFLGDRVLGLSVAALLYGASRKHARWSLPGITTRSSARGCCAEVALGLELGQLLIMAPSEARTGGRKKAVILADACEALLGAIHVDGGLQPRKRWCTSFGGRMSRMPLCLRPTQRPPCRNMRKARNAAFPKYRETARSGADHAPSFTVRLR